MARDEGHYGESLTGCHSACNTKHEVDNRLSALEEFKKDKEIVINNTVESLSECKVKYNLLSNIVVKQNQEIRELRNRIDGIELHSKQNNIIITWLDEEMDEEMKVSE